MIRLIQDQDLNARQIDRASIDMVQEPAGTCGDDIHMVVQFLDLCTDAYSAVDGCAAQLRLAAQLPDDFMGLFAELPRRSDNQCTDAVARLLHEPLQNRQNKGCGFPGTGLGKAHDIAAFHDRRDCFELNGCRRRVTQGLYAGMYLRM